MCSVSVRGSKGRNKYFRLYGRSVAGFQSQNPRRLHWPERAAHLNLENLDRTLADFVFRHRSIRSGTEYAGLTVPVVVLLWRLGEWIMDCSNIVNSWSAASRVVRGNLIRRVLKTKAEYRESPKPNQGVQHVMRLAVFASVGRKIGTAHMRRIYNAVGLNTRRVNPAVETLIFIKHRVGQTTICAHCRRTIRHFGESVLKQSDEEFPQLPICVLPAARFADSASGRKLRPKSLPY